jgi:CheY-like chemotaxis protein
MRRLLIVDDDEAVRKFLRTRLEDTYEIIDTGNPEQAFLLTLKDKPDAILMDLSMPRVSGFELCRTFSALSLTRKIPIFVVSGKDVRNKSFCQSLGASGFFEKPIDFPRLKNALVNALLSGDAEPREGEEVPLKVLLKLRGRAEDGREFEVRAVTDCVGANGFLCKCTTPAPAVSIVEVYLSSGEEHYLGRAILAKTEGAESRFTVQFADARDEREEQSFRESAFKA